MNDSDEPDVTQLLQAKAAYYNGSPLMSDAEFDQLEEQLRKQQPNHPYFNQVGFEVMDDTNTDKITHKVAMLSMDKAKQVAGINAWFQRLQDSSLLKLNLETPLCIQPKIDGISASCYYQNDKLQYVASRGDGRQGQNISHIAPFIKDIPAELDITAIHNLQYEGIENLANFEVRGELYLPKNGNIVQTGGRPLRNICAGLINRKEQSPEEMRQLRFIAYQCPQQRLANSEYQQVLQLAKLGFHTVESKQTTIAQLKTYYQLYLNELRQIWPYETDGLIICLDDSQLFAAIDALWVVSHHHHYAIALKPPAESGTTLLREVHWQLGRQGRLSPVAEFLPLNLASAMIERASLHNYANVKRLNIQRGDILEVERAGDVIPYVQNNLGSLLDNLQSHNLPEDFALNCYANSKEHNPIPIQEACLFAKKICEQFGRSTIPQQCPSCSGALHEQGVDLICPNRSCPEQVVQRILFWVKQSSMEHVAEQSIRQLYQQGKLYCLQDLYNLTAEDLGQIPGYAEKKINRFLSERENSRQLNVQQLVERLGIPMLQQKSLQKLGELRRKSRWENFVRQVAQQWRLRQNPLEWQDSLEQTIQAALPLYFRTNTTDLFSEKWEETLDWGELSHSLVATLLGSPLKISEQTLEKPPEISLETKLEYLWQAWGSQTGRNEIHRRSFSPWLEKKLEQQNKEFCHKLAKKEHSAKWKIWIEQMGTRWAATEAERQHAILQDAMLHAFSQTVSDWQPYNQYANQCEPAPHKTQLAKHLIEELQQAMFPKKAAGPQRFLALWRTWESQSGRNELWKKGFSIWQKILLSKQPHYLELRQIEDLSQFYEPASRYSVLENLNQWLVENQILLQELIAILKFENVANQNRQLADGGKNICMTGSGPLARKQLQEKLEINGYQVSSTMNKNTNILLCGNPTANSSKLQKAKEWGIAIYSYDEFLANLPNLP